MRIAMHNLKALPEGGGEDVMRGSRESVIECKVALTDEKLPRSASLSRGVVRGSYLYLFFIFTFVFLVLGLERIVVSLYISF